MKKILFVLLLMFPLTTQAKDYVLHCDSLNGISEYKDSIIGLDMFMVDETVFTLTIINKTDNRITVEWENVKIGGSHIAFFDDYLSHLNRHRQEEVITAGDVLVNTLIKRYSSLMPIVDKKKIKKEGSDHFYLLLPIKYGDKTKDYRFDIFVTRE